MKCRWDDETANGECEERRRGLCHRSVEVLFKTVETTGNECHSKDEETGGGVNAGTTGPGYNGDLQVTQDTSYQGGLDNDDLPLEEC